MKTGIAKNGAQWAIEVRESHDKRYYPIVTVRSKKRIADYTYKTKDSALGAGIYLLDLMLSEVGTCRAD